MGFPLPAITTPVISLRVVTKTYVIWDDPFAEYSGIRDFIDQPVPSYLSRMIAAPSEPEPHYNLNFAATTGE